MITGRECIVDLRAPTDRKKTKENKLEKSIKAGDVIATLSDCFIAAEPVSCPVYTETYSEGKWHLVQTGVKWFVLVDVYEQGLLSLPSEDVLIVRDK